MKSETFNIWSIALQSVGTLVSIGVGIVVWWYTKETQKIRQQGQKQIELLTEQVRQGQTQTMVAREQVQHGSQQLRIQSQESRQSRIPYVSAFAVSRTADKSRYLVKVSNPTEKVAHSLNVLLRTAVGYYWSDNGIDFLVSARDGHELGVFGPKDWTSIVGKTQAEYGAQFNCYIKDMESVSGNILAVFFRDIEHVLYMSIRQVELDENGHPGLHQNSKVVRPHFKFFSIG